MDTLVENGEFSSTSDLITVGMSNFLVRYELENNEVSAMDILVKMLQTPEGKRAFDKISSGQDNEKSSQDAPETSTGKNPKKIVIFEKDFPREYILE
ncbi:hypothetical protein [Methanosarcina sp.]|uniref:hypothetical protein n=1 Tax=Methanosarcina sp. TaxID=2213 RepID=UPI003BB7A3D4